MENQEVQQEAQVQPAATAVECKPAKKTFGADFFFATIAVSTLYVYVMLFSLIFT